MTDQTPQAESLDTLYREWAELREMTERKTPEGVSEAEKERFQDETGTAMIVLEGRIVAIPATTLHDAYIQFAILDFWNDGGRIAPTSAQDGYAVFRRRLKRFVGNADEAVDSDDPFPAWAEEWEAAYVTYRAGTSGIDPVDGCRLAELTDPIDAVEYKIINAPARTIAGVVVKLRVLTNWLEAGDKIPDYLAKTALAGAEHVMHDAERLGN